MKNSIITLFLFLLYSTGFAQNSKYELPARQTPSVKKEKLTEAKLVTDLSPRLWSSMVLSSNERYYLDHRRAEEFPQPANYVYPQERYKQTIDYVSVDISVISNGKILRAKSTSDKLTTEQKNILNAADPGTNIRASIKFKYKDQTPDNFGPRNNIVEGVSTVTVVPETEAEFPGGFKQLSAYFIGNVINKVSDKNVSEKVQRATVKFTVNEEGQITDAKVEQTSTDTKIDKLLLDATNKMPRWKPAENSKGIKVKQQISIPFGVGC